jgi:hypothetical protein
MTTSKKTKSAKKPIVVTFIGQYYYLSSSTEMSSLYVITPKGWERYDWGLIQVALGNKLTVKIQPATKAQLKTADKMLQEIAESTAESRRLEAKQEYAKSFKDC